MSLTDSEKATLTKLARLAAEALWDTVIIPFTQNKTVTNGTVKTPESNGRTKQLDSGNSRRRNLHNASSRNLLKEITHP